MNLSPNLLSFRKINLKMIKVFDVKSEMLKLLGINIGNVLHDLGVVRKHLRMTQFIKELS